MDLRTIEAETPIHRRTDRERPTTLVIADAGDSAWLLVLDAEMASCVGARFTFRGMTWAITGYRPHARAFVATLVGHSELAETA